MLPSLLAALLLSAVYGSDGSAGPLEQPQTASSVTTIDQELWASLLHAANSLQVLFVEHFGPEYDTMVNSAAKGSATMEEDSKERLGLVRTFQLTRLRLEAVRSVRAGLDEERQFRQDLQDWNMRPRKTQAGQESKRDTSYMVVLEEWQDLTTQSDLHRDILQGLQECHRGLTQQLKVPLTFHRQQSADQVALSISEADKKAKRWLLAILPQRYYSQLLGSLVHMLLESLGEPSKVIERV